MHSISWPCVELRLKGNSDYFRLSWCVIQYSASHSPVWALERTVDVFTCFDSWGMCNWVALSFEQRYRTYDVGFLKEFTILNSSFPKVLRVQYSPNRHATMTWIAKTWSCLWKLAEQPLKVLEYSPDRPIKPRKSRIGLPLHRQELSWWSKNTFQAEGRKNTLDERSVEWVKHGLSLPCQRPKNTIRGKRSPLPSK
jgi:hypothetical protein